MFLLSRWSGGLVAQFGAKRPLIAGPIIAAVGFLCFVFPSVGGNYWTTFFPGFVVLGLGMAVSVAPLTTVVMDAADQRLVGTASGINNAVARVAGLLAVAVLGVVMVSLFSHHLNQRLTVLALSVDAARVVRANEIKLAAITVPDSIDSITATALRSSIDQAFVFGFRLIMLMCAGLSAASSGFALAMIGGNRNLSAFQKSDLRQRENRSGSHGESQASA
jgi:MFS family permease